MGSAYTATVIARDANTATIRIFQMHQDYGLDPETFVDEWGAMALCKWAFTDAYAVRNFAITDRDAQYAPLFAEGDEVAALAVAVGSMDNLFDAPAREVSRWIRVTGTRLKRSAYDASNRDERLAAIGETQYTLATIRKICGELEIDVASDDPAILAPLVVGAEWEL